MIVRVAEEKEITGMRKIVDAVPAHPEWFARRRFTPEHTISYPVTVWAIVDEPDTSTRRAVVGVDASGQWPGCSRQRPGRGLRPLPLPRAQDGQPEDIVNPVHRHLKRGDEHAIGDQFGGLLS